MKYVLLLIAFQLCKGQPTYVIIDNIVGNINASQSCKVSAWSHKLESECVCCLLKQADAIKEHKISAIQAVELCIKQGICTRDSITHIMQENFDKKFSLDLADNKTEDILAHYIQELYQKTLLIQEIKKTTILGAHPTASQLGMLLEEAYKTKKLLNPDFKSISCYKVQDVLGKKGSYTKLLYSIRSTCSVPQGKEYILKESYGDEVYDVINASLIPGIEKFKDETSNPQYPRIILPFAYLSYTLKGKIHIFYLMPRAKGEILHDIMEAVNAGKRREEDSNEAFRQLGFQMANFYKYYMEEIPGKLLGATIKHGDFHPKNIFFDSASHQITLIDNATMQNIKDPYAIGKDFMKVLTWSKIIPYNTRLGNQLIKALLEGFMKIFPQKEAMEELISQFNQPQVEPKMSVSMKQDFVNTVQKIAQKIFSENQEIH